MRTYKCYCVSNREQIFKIGIKQNRKNLSQNNQHTQIQNRFAQEMSFKIVVKLSIVRFEYHWFA